jgi:hypothetical protein
MGTIKKSSVTPSMLGGSLVNTAWCVLRLRMEETASRYGSGHPPRGGPPAWGLDKNKIDLIEIGWDDMDWIDLAQDRDKWRALVNTVMNLRVP